MQTTANLGLKKPEGTDVVNIDDFNYNADIIDVEITKRALKTDIPSVSVKSVNGKTGNVNLKAEHIKTADGKTLEEFKTSTNASLDKKANKQISDDTTTKKYELGINNGLLYYREVIN